MVESSQKGFRSVRINQAASFIPNNLTQTNGTSFALARNTEKGGQIFIYIAALINKASEQVSAKVQKVASKDDVLQMKYVQIKGTWFLVVC